MVKIYTSILDLHNITFTEYMTKYRLVGCGSTIPSLKLELILTLIDPTANALPHTGDGIRGVPTDLDLLVHQSGDHPTSVTLDGCL